MLGEGGGFAMIVDVESKTFNNKCVFIAPYFY